MLHKIGWWTVGGFKPAQNNQQLGLSSQEWFELEMLLNILTPTRWSDITTQWIQINPRTDPHKQRSLRQRPVPFIPPGPSLGRPAWKSAVGFALAVNVLKSIPRSSQIGAVFGGNPIQSKHAGKSSMPFRQPWFGVYGWIFGKPSWHRLSWKLLRKPPPHRPDHKYLGTYARTVWKSGTPKYHGIYVHFQF